MYNDDKDRGQKSPIGSIIAGRFVQIGGTSGSSSGQILKDCCFRGYSKLCVIKSSIGIHGYFTPSGKFGRDFDSQYLNDRSMADVLAVTLSTPVGR